MIAFYACMSFFEMLVKPISALPHYHAEEDSNNVRDVSTSVMT